MANNFSEPEPKPAAKSQPEPAEGKRPKIYLPKLQLAEAVFDASMFIAFKNEDQRIRQHLGNPQIFHTKITVREWRGHFLYFEKKRREDEGLSPEPPNGRLARKRTARALAVFDSTYLPETPQVKAIAGEIIRCLQQEGIKELMGHELSRNDKRDIGTMAYAMAYGMDAVAADKLFYTVGRMFQSASTMHVNRIRNSTKQALRLLGRLEKHGVETRKELTHLIKLNSSEDVRRAADAEKTADAERTADAEGTKEQKTKGGDQDENRKH